MNSQPVVSVPLITYNHEPHIAQALESVLMQKTHFPIEIVVGEDCSTDKTREIVVEYQNRYPAFDPRAASRTEPGSVRNVTATLNACRGTYIAALEGDDYWTSADKF